MIKVGLTGGIGSGKSTASNFLKKLGYKVIDADIISREVLVIYSEILIKIKDEFSETVFENGELNRKKLGEIIFKSKSKKVKLENLILPYIIKEINDRFALYEKAKEEIVFLDAPTLIENGLHKNMNYNILVYACEEVQIQRVKQRDNLSDEEVRNRIASQMPLKEKKDKVDFIISNNKDVDSLEKEIIKVIKKLRGKDEV